MDGAPGFATLGDLEAEAQRKVDAATWGYIAGGAGEERTILENRRAFARRVLRPRLLAEVAHIDISTHMLGEALRAPFYIAPMAYQALIHPDGEAAMTRAATDAGVLTMVSTLSSYSIEAISSAAPQGRRWFQLYLQPDPTVTLQLLERAEASGCSAIVLTADAPVLGIRDRQRRSGFALDETIPLGNGPSVVPPSRGPTPDPDGGFTLRRDAASGWDVMDWLRAHTDLPLVVKGVLSAEDARHALDHGARAVIVSNHGGRQLDGTPAALDALPEVVREVGEDGEVYLDGGVRRGADVAIALALGAKAVGLGRPALHALAAGGADGVAHLLDLLKVELANVMALIGRRTLSELDPPLVGETRSI
ncbi:MAG: alpha-hydroxy acid oxidase [Thermoplasmata archaeon]